MVLDERFEDDGSDLRVYSLAPLPEGSVASVVRALETTHQPVWPVWAPRWAFPDPAQQAKAESAIDRVLEQAGPPELAVATSNLASEIREARTITAADVATVDDWLGLLTPTPSKR